METEGWKKKLIILAMVLLFPLANGATKQDFSYRGGQVLRSHFFDKFILRKQQYSPIKATKASVKELSHRPSIVSEVAVSSASGIATKPKMAAERETEVKAITPESKISTISTSKAEDNKEEEDYDYDEDYDYSGNYDDDDDEYYGENIDFTDREPPADYDCPEKTNRTQKEVPSGFLKDYRGTCGIRAVGRTGRIVGGQQSFQGKWPWQVAVRHVHLKLFIMRALCGGVLINSKYVVTSAHCHVRSEETELYVILGAQDRCRHENDLKSFGIYVKRMIIHRDYKPATSQTEGDNDLALLELESPVEFLPHILPICLPQCDEDFLGKMAFVTGWGRLETGNATLPRSLQEVQVPILPNAECKKMLLDEGIVANFSSKVICAAYREGGKGPCSGDSGGPLVVKKDDGRWVLVGIVSYSFHGCATPRRPTVYTSIPFYRGWIESVVFGERVNSIPGVEEQLNTSCDMQQKEPSNSYLTEDKIALQRIRRTTPVVYL